MFYTLTYRTDGTITGYCKYSEPQDVLPSDQIECTEDQYNNWQSCVVADGAVSVSAEKALAVAKADKTAQLSARCAAEIASGFASAALGIDTFYPTTDNDQRNLQSSALAGAWNAGDTKWRVPLWCRQRDTWAYVEHTAQQVQQVNVAWVDFRAAAQQRYATAIEKVSAAVDIEAVRAVDVAPASTASSVPDNIMTS